MISTIYTLPDYAGHKAVRMGVHGDRTVYLEGEAGTGRVVVCGRNGLELEGIGRDEASSMLVAILRERQAWVLRGLGEHVAWLDAARVGAWTFDPQDPTATGAGRAVWACRDLLGVELRHAELSLSVLTRCCLVRADLLAARLHRASLCGADLRGADLRGVDLRGADLRWADLRGADLRGADLRGADLGDGDEAVDLRDADLRWAVLDGDA